MQKGEEKKQKKKLSVESWLNDKGSERSSQRKVASCGEKLGIIASDSHKGFSLVALKLA